ncbi:MAG: 50S ribosomal protein L25 [Planctomycetota bacterium]|jgi:large subunit ribosomal protein L25
MSKPDTLKTNPRTGSGSAAARRQRREGEVPVIVYGHGEDNQSLTIEAHALDLALASQTQVFTLEIGKKQQPCLVKNVQYDTFGQHVLHVDFTRVSLTEEVEVEVELEISGDAKGVAAGGTLAVQHPALWVKCLANAIPDSIQIDVTELDIGQGIHAGEIELPKGVRLDEGKHDPSDQMVGVLAPRVEVEEEAPEEGVEGEAPAEGEAAPVDGEAAPGEPASGGSDEDKKD